MKRSTTNLRIGELEKVSYTYIKIYFLVKLNKFYEKIKFKWISHWRIKGILQLNSDAFWSESHHECLVRVFRWPSGLCHPYFRHGGLVAQYHAPQNDDYAHKNSWTISDPNQDTNGLKLMFTTWCPHTSNSANILLNKSFLQIEQFAIKLIGARRIIQKCFVDITLNAHEIFTWKHQCVVT